MRPGLIAVLALNGYLLASLEQSLEPLFVQAFIAELANEALDVPVLHGLAGLDRMWRTPCERASTP